MLFLSLDENFAELLSNIVFMKTARASHLTKHYTTASTEWVNDIVIEHLLCNVTPYKAQFERN